LIPETFWLDLQLSNPLHIEVVLANFTVKVTKAGSDDPLGDEIVEVEVIPDISLDPRETRTVRTCLI
jgi:hypothetical protein